MASDLAGLEERRRRDGAGYAGGTDALASEWARQFPRRDRDEMIDWIRYHGVHVTATRCGFAIETSSGPGTGAG